jgi:TolA-binding protein
MPTEFGWPQLYTVVTEIRTDQQSHTDMLRQLQLQSDATHQSIEELTSRVSDLEIGTGSRDERHDRRRRRRDPAAPGSSRR